MFDPKSSSALYQTSQQMSQSQGRLDIEFSASINLDTSNIESNITLLLNTSGKLSSGRKLFVKNISEELPDSVFESLLKECGPLVKWKRTKDEKNISVNFGYCEFESVEGVLRCMRLLNKFTLHGKMLDIKPSQKTQELLSEFLTIKREEIKLIGIGNINTS